MGMNTYEILKDCFDPQNGTFNVTPDNEQEIFRAVYDAENHALRVTLSGGTSGSGLWEVGSGNNSAKLISQNGNIASGDGSVVIGGFGDSHGTVAIPNQATSLSSYAEGYGTVSSNWATHAEGVNTIASGKRGAHAEGINTIASGELGSHAEGSDTEASGSASHSEGYNTTASGNYSHTEGWYNLSSGFNSHTECGSVNMNVHDFNIASGSASHAEGCNTRAIGDASHTGGFGFTAPLSNVYNYIKASGKASFNHSFMDNSFGDTAVSDAEADYSAILGGIFNNISISANNSVILGGNEQTLVNPNTVMMPRIELTLHGEGIRIFSPNGTEYKITVDDAGNLVSTAI